MHRDFTGEIFRIICDETHGGIHGSISKGIFRGTLRGIPGGCFGDPEIISGEITGESLEDYL